MDIGFRSVKRVVAVERTGIAGDGLIAVNVRSFGRGFWIGAIDLLCSGWRRRATIEFSHRIGFRPWGSTLPFGHRLDILLKRLGAACLALKPGFINELGADIVVGLSVMLPKWRR